MTYYWTPAVKGSKSDKSPSNNLSSKKLKASLGSFFPLTIIVKKLYYKYIYDIAKLETH